MQHKGQQILVTDLLKNIKSSLDVYPVVGDVTTREPSVVSLMALKIVVDPTAKKQVDKSERLKIVPRSLEIVGREWNSVEFICWKPVTAKNNTHLIETDISPQFVAWPNSTITTQPR